MKQPFEFKQFKVAHDICAQKVGTDGVLLGAWTTIFSNYRSILDIGTGSGLIALMLAQRTNENVFVHAVDIDKAACKQATINFNNSKWSNRLKVFHTSIQNFLSEKKYDLIICNPPFFSNSLQPENEQRTLARHDNLLPLEDFFLHAKRLFSENGSVAVILPYDKKNIAVHIAELNGLIPFKVCNVKGNESAPYKRVLLQFINIKNNSIYCEENLIIEAYRNHYTNEYKLLTKDFYLKF